MALDLAELEQLGNFIKSEISKGLADVETRLGSPAETASPAPAAVSDRTAVVGTPDVAPDAGPLYYVHLADGTVVQSHDSGSTHIANDAGVPVQVIGRYQVGG